MAFEVDKSPPVIAVDLQDLTDGSVTLDTLEAAFGEDSLGIIIVRGLPARYAQLRHELLSLASCLANLPDEQLRQLERPEAKFNAGWSCGKEKLADGRYDTYKGSYYAQPVYNEELEAKARKLYPDLIAFVAPNVWPEDTVLPGFRQTFEELCRLIIDTAALVARACDRYGVAKLEGYLPGTLENIVRESVSTKARLLHYFPPPPQPRNDSDGSSTKALDDDWCATHFDLGALTGLTSNMFIDEETYKPIKKANGRFPTLVEMDRHPDPEAGLWIKDRSGKSTQVQIPKDCLAFQTGMALQLITRGKFRAVPHFVRGAAPGSSGKIARNTLAVFTQPNLWEMVGDDRDFAKLAQEIIDGTYDQP